MTIDQRFAMLQRLSGDRGITWADMEKVIEDLAAKEKDLANARAAFKSAQESWEWRAQELHGLAYSQGKNEAERKAAWVSLARADADLSAKVSLVSDTDAEVQQLEAEHAALERRFRAMGWIAQLRAAQINFLAGGIISENQKGEVKP